mgnify:CR=1 FL=1
MIETAYPAVDDVRVALGARSYTVRVGQGLLARAGAEIAPFLNRKRVAVITEDTVCRPRVSRPRR